MKARMTPDGYDVTIIGEPANLNYFVKTDLEADELTAVVDKQSFSQFLWENNHLVIFH